jgi:NitT/TauT family transport system substrate-binding protein
MLPVPAATAVQIQAKQAEDRDVVSVLDLTQEWGQVTQSGVLTMGCVVARTEFVQEHPDEVAAFLEDYQASIDYVNSNVDDASALVEQFGIVPKAAIAKLAIPDCNLVYITGEEMREQIQGYYQVLYQADPTSIGGGIPDDGFYYGVE